MRFSNCPDLSSIWQDTRWGSIPQLWIGFEFGLQPHDPPFAGGSAGSLAEKFLFSERLSIFID